MKTYRIGIIGFGFMGKVHAYAYQNLKYYYDLPFEIELRAVAAHSEATLAKARKHGFSLYSRNAEDVIRHPEIDIVDICSPNVAHCSQLLGALDTGKPIYCEKPVVTGPEEARRIEQALAGYRAVNQVTFHNRFFPATLKTRSLVKHGLLGTPIHFHFRYYHSGSLEKEKPMGWKQEKGAGVLLDMGSHAIDLAFWFLGEIAQVIASSRVLYPERLNRGGTVVPVEAEDSVVILTRMKNGATGIIEASKIAAGSQDELSYDLYGTGGAIAYNSMEPNYLKVFDQNRPDQGFASLPTVQRYVSSTFPGPKFGIGWLRGHIHSIYNFLRCVDGGTPASPSLADGLYNLKVCDAVKRSEQTAKWETVTP